MRKNIELSDEQLNMFVNQFYEYFDREYAFEEFLKVYLEKIFVKRREISQEQQFLLKK